MDRSWLGVVRPHVWREGGQWWWFFRGTRVGPLGWGELPEVTQDSPGWLFRAP